MKLNETDIEGLISSVRDSLSKARLEDFEKEEYINSIEDILEQYKDHLSEESELRYRIHKRGIRMEVILYIHGEKWDPLEQGADAADLSIKEKIRSLSFDNSSAMSYHYIRGYNILALRSPSFKKHRSILKQPMIWAMILGIVAGIVCRFLPPAVSAKSKAKISVLLHKLKPIFLTVFAAGSELVALRASYEDSKNKLGIREDFTSFWIPMNQALLAPASTISFALAPFMVAKLTETPVSLTFLLVLLVLLIELSLASPGLSAGWTIILSSLGMSAEYVGVFSAYSVFIKNAAAGFGISYRLLEEIEAACLMDKIDKEILWDKESGMQAENA